MSTGMASPGGYSPVDVADDGSVSVQLEEDHPGFSDPAYRDRRNAIAQLSIDHHRVTRFPSVDYTDHEHEVWRIVSTSSTPGTRPLRMPGLPRGEGGAAAADGPRPAALRGHRRCCGR